MSFSKQNYSILMIDDDEDDFIILSDLVKEIGKHLTIEWVSSYKSGIKTIHEKRHDLYFIDNRLGAEHGLDLIREARENGNTMPMVLLTGAGNRELDIQALRYGAADYLVKGELNYESLERCIRHCLQRYEYSQIFLDQQRQFRVFFESSLAPTFILHSDLSFEEVNRAFIEKFGSIQDNKTLTRLFVSIEEAAKIENHLNQRAVDNYATHMHNKEMKVIDVLLSVSHYHSDTGEGIRYFGVINDLTQIREAQKQLALAEQVNMTGRMARIMAHEIRNPLTNINLAADQLRDELEEKGSDEDDLAFIDLIKRNSERINKLITDLLNTTKETKLSKEPYDLKLVVEEACELIKDRIILKKINLHIEGLDDGVQIPMDAERMRIAILNIFTNAIEAMDESESRELKISLKHGQGNQIQLDICDTGRGMTEDIQRRIFEPFYTGRSGGMGLGMTAVMNILNAHDTQIHLESKLGEGSCFSIRFPEQ